MRKFIYVINAQGERELFSRTKLYNSARRVGASHTAAKRVVEIIGKEVYPGIETREIFERIKSLLSHEAPKSAIRFSLKKAMMELGPSGFPFEKYIGEIFSRWRFKVMLNQHLAGHCLNYEIDFLAKSRDSFYVGECKYRNLPEGLVSPAIVLANYARFLDLKRGKFFARPEFKKIKLKNILVTNTKFSKNAIKFAKCVGIDLLGWRYPKTGGLEYFIESQNLYPITILSSLTRDLAGIFVARRIMLVEDILKLDIEKFAKKIKISPNRLRPLIEEAKILFK